MVKIAKNIVAKTIPLAIISLSNFNNTKKTNTFKTALKAINLPK